MTNLNETVDNCIKADNVDTNNLDTIKEYNNVTKYKNGIDALRVHIMTGEVWEKVSKSVVVDNKLRSTVFNELIDSAMVANDRSTCHNLFTANGDDNKVVEWYKTATIGENEDKRPFTATSCRRIYKEWKAYQTSFDDDDNGDNNEENEVDKEITKAQESVSDNSKWLKEFSSLTKKGEKMTNQADIDLFATMAKALNTMADRLKNGVQTK